MMWIRTHIGMLLTAAAALFAVGGGVSYGQMVYYDNYETANWLTVAAWFATAVVAFVTAVLASGAAPRLMATSSQGTLSQVRQLREQAAAARKSADASDAAAAKAIAANEAELESAKALMPEVQQ
ncbi:MAG: hypothetical protein V4719_00890 [Planctomycetota bacterium]